jgi:2-amino-4-hydroxy-6-hydroxymethyldihydropteridine diphosphokinase
MFKQLCPLSRQPVVAVDSEKTVWLGLGANLGDRAHTLRRAVRAVGGLPGTRMVAVASLYATEPIPAGGPQYLNTVMEIVTTLASEALLRHLQAIELAAGRARPYRNAPRTLDIDILLFGDDVIRTEQLHVPHPRMHERAFVLRPLAELQPQRVSAQALLQVQDQAITLHQGPDWIHGKSPA